MIVRPGTLITGSAATGEGDATPGGGANAFLQEDGVFGFLLEDGTSDLLME